MNKARKMADTQPNFYYDLGRAYHLGYEFMKAMEAYQRFLGTSENEALNAKAAKNLEDCFTGMELVKFPIDVEIENLGPDVNSPVADYTPFVDDAESILVFSSKRKRGNQQDEPDKQGHYTSDIYLSAIDNGVWKRPKNLGKNIN